MGGTPGLLRGAAGQSWADGFPSGLLTVPPGGAPTAGASRSVWTRGSGSGLGAEPSLLAGGRPASSGAVLLQGSPAWAFGGPIRLAMAEATYWLDVLRWGLRNRSSVALAAGTLTWPVAATGGRLLPSSARLPSSRRAGCRGGDVAGGSGAAGSAPSLLSQCCGFASVAGAGLLLVEQSVGWPEGFPREPDLQNSLTLPMGWVSTSRAGDGGATVLPPFAWGLTRFPSSSILMAPVDSDTPLS